ncbi:esterase-like activity of phytase family protein [Hyphomonas pacifica]|uniref:Uncharacterized protein n=1 Tax=Hyphomonas pacifica TaxID=1280941 RepID=A0A062TUZ7_9PROT|nr:esterase-like activity of phytase family protein [Hyphomonas pacifica]KCZ51826.1 hypothetical protein HY2_10350 [Hyphomonas pacifica]RAN34572.1 hypothetical protein HY3_10535 [Hyphomonas pacifica]
MRTILLCLLMLPTLPISCTAPSESERPHPTLSSSGITESTGNAASLKIIENSCPTGAQKIAPTPIDIQATSIPLWPEDKTDDLPTGIRFLGGWVLTSSHQGFGGLSGIDLLSDGSLLTVSDEGAFVWIDMSNDAPAGSGKFAYMRGPDGSYLRGKTDGDSEGLALDGGIAYVSFERRHRIEAFALEACGAEARSVLVSTLPREIDGTRIHENAGAEALALNKRTLQAGFEQVINGRSAVAISSVETSSIEMLDPVASGYGGPLVGMSDASPRASDDGQQVTFALRRQFNPLFGNRLTIEARYSDADGHALSANGQPLLKLSPPMNVDNFEGITAKLQSDGSYRLWLISDNNFSPRQRTLLYAFDITLP